MMNTWQSIINYIIKFLGVVFSTCFIHWALVNTYCIFCAPPSWFGPISTFISLGSPLCQFINYVQYELAKHYITIWAAAGIALTTWLIAKLT